MRVGFISYPMLFQRPGGLQIQMMETAAALKGAGTHVDFVDPVRQKLSDFDILHVFAANNGNFRIVESAHDQQVPVVLSPLIRGQWNRKLARRARILESIVGHATDWAIRTEYREIAACLTGADAIIALGEAEKRSIVSAFSIPAERITVVPNGIPERFFAAKPEVFCERFGIEPGFVLNVATISSHKNQLALARALEGTGLRVVLIGACPTDGESQSYLSALKSYKHVTYVGSITYDDPALPSAYAAASLFCLPSRSEVMPLSAMEALAAGTPVVMTKFHGMDPDVCCPLLRFVSPADEKTIRALALELARAPQPAFTCIDLARRFSWPSVAQAIVPIYRSLQDT